MNKKLLLILIVIIASILRLYSLADFPRGFHDDEAAFGYNAYSLLTTGRDEFGVRLPLFLRSFNDYKAAIYSYIATVPIYFWGLTEVAVRLPTAFFGIFSIIGLFLLIKKLTNNSSLALLASFIMTITPWHINLSRGTNEMVVAMALLIWGFWFLLDDKKTHTVTALLLFSIALYTYHSVRVFLPIFVITLYFFIFRQRRYIISFLIIIILVAISIIAPGGGSRFKDITIFNSGQETQLILDRQIREDGGQGPLVTRFFHNKAANYFLTITEITGKYFSYDFLLSDKGEPLRQRIPQSGLLFFWQAPILLYAFARLLSKRNIADRFFALWFITSLAPLILVFAETPSVHRSLFTAIPLIYFISTGLLAIFSKKRTFLLAVLCVIAGYEFTHYLHQYYYHSLYDRPWYRQQGYKEMLQAVNQHINNYDKVLFTNGQSAPHIYVLFYQKIDPVKYWKEGSPMDLKEEGFDKYMFSKHECPSQITEVVTKMQGVKTLYIDNGLCGNYPANTKYEVIRRSDKTPVFNIIY